MNRIVSIAAAALVATLLVMIPAAPASADTGVCAGMGGMTVGGPGNGLYHPALGPKRDLPFAFGNGPLGGLTCITAPPAPLVKTLFATGAVNGYCGLLIGRGEAWGTEDHDFLFIGVGGQLIFAGEITGSLFVASDATIAGNSCLPTGGGASQFIVFGALAKNHVIPVIAVQLPPALPAVCPNPPACP